MGPQRHAEIPLFREYPKLGEELPYVSLGEFPTPIQRCERLGAELGLEHLFIKRDDLSGRLYGGNKVRKLEFLLGEALRRGAKEVLTFGYAGSNHALATALYAHQLGLNTTSMLLPQPNSHGLQRNLLLARHCGAELHEYGGRYRLYGGTLCQALRHRLRTGRFPFVIRPGGSSPLGVTGIVSAAFELRDQVHAGVLDEPDLIYVAVGSMGTAVGLSIGLRAAGLQTRVVPVRVIDRAFANPVRMTRLARATMRFLGDHDPAFPTYEPVRSEYILREGFFGEQYALYTPAGVEAMGMMRETEGITLDGTYSGKALAALIADARTGKLLSKTVLFWNTYNSRSPWSALPDLEYHNLPKRFHRYFKDAVQPLDVT